MSTPLISPSTLGDLIKRESDPDYTRETVTLKAGTAYPLGAVLGRITASGKFAKHDPAASNGAEKAIAILAYDVATPTLNKKEAIYVGGVFNMDALTWHADTDTDAERAAAFDGTNIVAQKLLGNPPAGSGPV